MSKQVYLKITIGESVSFVGGWSLPNEKIDNFDTQQSIGWHIFLTLQKEPDAVIEAVYGDQGAAHEEHKAKRV